MNFGISPRGPFQYVVAGNEALRGVRVGGKELAKSDCPKDFISMVTAQCFCDRVNNLVLFIKTKILHSEETQVLTRCL